MGISSIRCRRWFSEFPTTPLPQPVAKNNHCCYLNIFQSPSSLFLYSSFFTETKSSCLGWVTYLWGCQTPLSPSWLKGVAVGQPIFTNCSLSKVKVSTLLSGCHVWERQLEARADCKVVELTAPACLPVQLLGSHWLLLLTATCSSTHRRLRGLYCHVVFASIVNNCFHLKAESNQKIIFLPLKTFVSHTFWALYIFSPLNPIGNVEIQFLVFITHGVSKKQFPV